MFNRALALLGSSLATLATATRASAQSMISLEGLDPTRLYGPRVVTDRNIGKSYGCTLRRMTKDEIDALPLHYRRGDLTSFKTHEHRRRYMPHIGAKEIARHSGERNGS